MSPIRPGLRPACLLATLLVATAAGACKTDNPNFCGDGDTRPECTGIDAGIDGRTGCMANPALCMAGVETCAADDTCVDCVDGNDHQSADCTEAASPVCATNRDCRACAADSECDSAFCDHGLCAPAAQVLFVKFTGGDDGGSNHCADRAMPCKTLTHALAEVPPTGTDPSISRRYIKLMAAETYAEPGLVTIDGKTVVIVGTVTSTDRSVIDRTNGGANMEIKGGADVRLEALAVANTTSSGANGIFCREGAKLLADNIEVANNTGIGLVGDTCNLTLQNSVVARSAGGGVSLTGNVRVVVVNNVIVDNGSSAAGGSDFGALLISASVMSTSVIQSNTAVSNHAVTGQPDGIDCRPAGLTTRNNIVTGDATKARVSGGCMHANVLYAPDDPGARLGGNNGNMLIPNEADLQFVNPATKDYHLKPASFAKGKGSTTGLAPEAAKDIDGQPRPQGAADVGADEVPD